MDLKIVKWVHFDDDYQMRGYTYDELFEVINIIMEEIINKGYCFSGEEHQNIANGMPLFNDGTCFRASMRAWGEIIASTRKELGEEDVTYMDYYMSRSDSIYPEDNDVEVKPLELEEVFMGLTLNQDKELIINSLQMGMELMNTDKVIKAIYKIFKEKMEE